MKAGGNCGNGAGGNVVWGNGGEGVAVQVVGGVGSRGRNVCGNGQREGNAVQCSVCSMSGSERCTNPPEVVVCV